MLRRPVEYGLRTRIAVEGTRPGLHARSQGWYNTRRIQKELGYLSPDEYETTWHAHAEPDNVTPAPTGGR